MDVERINELMKSDEPLLPELEPYAFFDPDLRMRILHHPLIIDVPFTSAAFINARYQAKKQKLEEYLESGNYSGAIALTERPYRLDRFMDFIDDIAGTEEFCKLAADVWIDSENIHRNLDAWREIWSMVAPSNREWLHEEREWEAFQSLPEHFEVYRGIGVEGAVMGLSWTTDVDKARWFADRNTNLAGLGVAAEPVLLTGTVNRSDVIAYFLQRGESEIVVLPEKVESIRRERLY